MPPPTARRRVRRNRISEVDAIAVAVVAVGCGVAAALAGDQPTAWGPSDAVVAGGAVAVVAWASASAPWWVVAVVAAAATLSASSVLLGSLAAVGFLVAVVIGSRGWSWPWGRTLAAGLALNVLLRWDQDWFHGWSALVTGAGMVALLVTGLNRRGRHVRARARRAAVLVGGAVVAVTLVAILTALVGRTQLTEGERALRNGVDALRDGDVAGASDAFAEARDVIGDADRVLGGPWMSISRAVPLIGQHVAAVQEVTAAGLELSASASDSIEQINVESLRMVQGVIDVAAIEVLGVPFDDTADALASAGAQVRAVRSPWLVDPVGSRLAELDEQVTSLAETSRRGATAARLAPAMLGADGPRRYFVAFTTPAEARGLSGFMGSFAELSADDGRLTVERTGTTSELNGGLGEPRPTLTGLADDFMARYGRFGLGADGNPVSADVWSNITMSPDLAGVTDVIAQLYPASGGAEIDGVIVVDVETVAQFLVLTGPVTVEGPDGSIRLDENNAVDYLLRGQYADIDDDDARDAVLAELTEVLLDEVFGGDLPAPAVLAQTLGPAMDEGRLLMWTLVDAEQTALVELGVSGTLERPEADGLVVVSNNASANKLDTYLRRSITYQGTVIDGELRTTVTVRLANDAPDGLPADVSGNPFGLPSGTNRSYLSIYSPWQFTSATLDGEPIGMEVETEAGWNVYSVFVDIPRGGEVVVDVGLGGSLEHDGPYSLWLRSQPMALPDMVRLDVRGPDAETLVASHGIRMGTELVTAD